MAKNRKPASARDVAHKAVMLVADKGFNSDKALEQAGISQLTDTRDSAFARSICLGTLRWYHQLDALLKLLLDKPLQRKHRDIHHLLLTALFQLSHTDIARHGVVSATVDIVYILKKKWARGLVNAVLRNYLREVDTLNAKISKDNAALNSHPAWLLKTIEQSWPEKSADIMLGNNTQAPMSLRVNLLRSSREDYLQQLNNKDINAKISPITPAGIILDAPCQVEKLPGFADGLVSVQDIAPQLAANLLDLKQGHNVLDACAAPGGKTAHIIESSTAKVTLTALELDSERLPRIKQNMTRLGHQLEVVQGDATEPGEWWSGELFDRILLDAPCSGTGVIRRHPDIKLLRRPSDIDALSQQQLKLLSSLWKLLKSGGKLLYATCSILPQENEQVIKQFLSQEDHAKELQIGVNYAHQRLHGIQILPGEHQMDGFFYACLQKA